MTELQSLVTAGEVERETLQQEKRELEDNMESLQREKQEIKSSLTNIEGTHYEQVCVCVFIIEIIS